MRRHVRTVIAREHEPLRIEQRLTGQDKLDLVENGVLKYKPGGGLGASNHVGVVATRRGLMLEILPKIKLDAEDNSCHEKTRQAFLRMLRCWRGLFKALSESDIRAMARFPMLDVFARQFLLSVNALSRAGLARRYISVEENLPCLRGRLLFREQTRENLANSARFFVAYDELSINRPANRLIRSALARLAPTLQGEENRLLLRQLTAAFADVPKSADPHADWQKHRVDRSMHLYAPVMQWAGLFLFGKGLATFAGQHANISLLFPMEKVFENFVARSFSRYQSRYQVATQGPEDYLAKVDGEEAFRTKPDIALKRNGSVRFILDTKWKVIDESGDDPKHDISQADMYQLYAYGKRYGCETVALIYPRSGSFAKHLRYRFFDELTLLCLPFDVADQEKTEKSIEESLRVLERNAGT